MDAYVPIFQKAGGSMVMLAKGNRSRQVTDACKKYGGFYLVPVEKQSNLINIRQIRAF